MEERGSLEEEREREVGVGILRVWEVKLAAAMVDELVCE